MHHIEFVLYVANQEHSRDFYSKVLALEPCLDVPGMTEFALSDSVKLGLMPEKGIARILQPLLPHPADGAGIPRCELYLRVSNAATYIQRAVDAGAQLISALEKRDWGDTVAYLADTDGHVIAFVDNK